MADPRRLRQGYEARTVFDEMTADMKMNGQPLPFGMPAPKLAGQTPTITYDQDGRMVDVAAVTRIWQCDHAADADARDRQAFADDIAGLSGVHDRSRPLRIS